LSRDHAEALSRLRHGLEAGRGVIVLIGEVGTGKTTLAYALLTSLGPSVRTAYIANPKLAFEGLVRLALADFGVECEARDRDGVLATLRAFLDECAADGHTAVLVIDESQSLDDDTFESLPLLSGLPVLLLGQTELDAKLKEPRLRAVADAIAVRIDLGPLDESESRRYIAHRLEKAGGSIALFDPAALASVLRYAKGIPRRMNILCHNALLKAHTAGASQVTPAMVREAIKELQGGTLVLLDRSRELYALPRSRYARPAAAGIAAVAALAVVGVLWRRAPAPTATETAEPPRIAAVEVSTTLPDLAPTTVPAQPVVGTTSTVLPDEARRVPPEIEIALATPRPTTPPPAAAPSTAPPTTRPTTPPSTLPRPTTTRPPTTVPRPTTTTPPPTVPPPPPPPPAEAPPPEPPPAVALAAVEKPPPVVARSVPSARSVSDADVRAFLDRYVRSWRTRDVAELRRIGQVTDDRQAQALDKYFDTVEELEVEVRVLEMSGSGDRRTVRFTRRDRFRDPAGREVSKESPPIEKTIVRTPDGLKFAPRS
jgi:general secretion pathway protein A